MATSNFQVAYLSMVVMGLTHPCKNIICFNFCLESTPKRNREFLVNLIMVTETTYIIIITLYYQFVTKYWLPLQVFALAQIVLCIVVAFRFFDESPKFYFNTKRYSEARQRLEQIAYFNGIKNYPHIIFEEEANPPQAHRDTADSG